MVLIDISESEEVERLIAQAIDTSRVPLNQHGFADFMWNDYAGGLKQLENKSWTELLWNVDGCEDQLRRYSQQPGLLGLIIRGLAIPVRDGVNTYKVTTKGAAVKQRSFKLRFGMISAWIWRLNVSGISVFQVPNEQALAQFIVSAYNNDQKAEHTILKRYNKKKETVWVPNTHVANLIGLRGTGVGEVRAKALVRKFRTTWGVLSASVDDLCSVDGIGEVTAKKLLRSVGRKV